MGRKNREDCAKNNKCKLFVVCCLKKENACNIQYSEIAAKLSSQLFKNLDHAKLQKIVAMYNALH